MKRADVRARRLQLAFTLIELVVVICLVAIFAAVALERLVRYQEIAEKTAMEQTIGALRSAQSLQVGARIIKGGLAALDGLAEENPMDWLASRPSNYVGELFEPTVSQVPKGSWYFDRKTRELVYRPNLTRHFTAGPAGDRIRFRSVIKLGGAGKNKRPTELTELDIVPTHTFRWTPEQ